jgi:hypothetical protein
VLFPTGGLVNRRNGHGPSEVRRNIKFTKYDDLPSKFL